MRLIVDHIKDSGLTLDGEEAAAVINRNLAHVLSGDTELVSPLKYHLRAQRIEEIVEIEGTLRANLHLSCSRCLAELSLELEPSFEVTFTRQDARLLEEDDGEGVELDADELGLSIYEGDEIDLHDMLLEQIVLALPARPLCREGCSGLCPDCGVDLNNKTCDCNPEPFNSKFAALKNFNPDK